MAPISNAPRYWISKAESVRLSPIVINTNAARRGMNGHRPRFKIPAMVGEYSHGIRMSRGKITHLVTCADPKVCRSGRDR